MKFIYISVFTILVACQTTDTEWKQSTDEEAKLIFDSSKFELELTSRDQRHNSSDMLLELIKFQHNSGKPFGEGQFIYAGTTKYSDNYIFDDEIPLSEKISKWFPSQRLEFGNLTQDKKHMGLYDFQRFKLIQTHECAAIQQYLGPIPVDQLSNRRTALGTILIRGFYCINSNEPLKIGTINSLFDAFDVPSRPKEINRAY
ncbi:hypothetical protein N9H39_09810 [Gammaproteobacteria bacterium]|nr:hypothetical protein [Gammaproteobacteria bacterium]